MKKLLVLVFAIALCLGVLCLGASAAGYDQNGFGDDGSYEPATQQNGVYQIGNAGQLYWFAQRVNGGEYGANAVLTANITINENVLNENGELNSGTFREWTPIGTDYEKAYTGTFDGNDKTISGLYYSGGGDDFKRVGLFGRVENNGVVQDLSITDSYISESNSYSASVGGVCGRNVGGTITNCSFAGSVTSTITDDNSSDVDVGGICGSNNGNIDNCSFTGSVTFSGTDTYVGGVCGGNVSDGKISNCRNTGSVTGNGNEIDVGGVCGYNYGKISDCRNTGSVTGNGNEIDVGGVCGYNEIHHQGSWRGGTITNCCNTGSVSGTGNEIYIGGVYGWSEGDNDDEVTIRNCYNTGSVTLTGTGTGTNYVGGVCGRNSDSATINCYNTGSVTLTGTGTNYVGGVCGRNGNRSTITNCYWLSGTATIGIGTGTGEATSKTTTEFTSGEVAWLLNSNQENGPWRQTLNADISPTLESNDKQVFQVMLDSMDYYCNDSFTFPEAPSKSGYSFVGWSDGSTTYEAGDEVPVTGDMTFTSEWEQMFSVTLVNGNGGGDKISYIEPNGTFTFPEAPSKSGYTFVHWSDGTRTYEAGDGVTITADTTFTAVWKQLFTVTVVYDNGTADTKEQVVDGDSFKLPETPSKSGYYFVGWSDGNTTYKAGAMVENITADTTFTAVWREINIPDPNSITVTQPANGTIRVNPSNGSAGTLITVTATPDEGYELAYITVDGEKITGNTFRMPDKSVTVSAVFVPATFPFVDVKTGDWFYDAVAYVYANGLMDGTSATTFEPNANMTRAMLWTILARIDGEEISGADWAETAREWAMASGVSDGADAGGSLTREQLAAMLYRFAGEPETAASLDGFTDAAGVSDWAAQAMAWCVEQGIITGVTDTSLDPQGSATRAQCSAMLMRFVENV